MLTPEAGNPDINRPRTVAEVGVSFVRGLVPAAGVYVLNEVLPQALRSAGITVSPVDWGDLKEVLANFPDQGAFLAGLGVGLAENALLTRKTFAELEGATRHGTYQPKGETDDGALLFQITCIDGRRLDDTGGAVPGGFALFGAPFNSVLLSVMTEKAFGDTLGGNFFAGYFLSRNILTGITAHLATFKEIGIIARKFPGRRLVIEIEDHGEGCGAAGLTNWASFWAKFRAYNPLLADAIAIPNEVTGYSYTNMIVAPLVGLLTGARVSVRAVTRRTELGIQR